MIQCQWHIHLRRFLSSILLLASLAVYGQRMVSGLRFLSVEEELEGRLYKSFAQDTDGFMWMLSYEGLSRYDGQNFRYYDLSPFRFSGGKRYCLTRDEEGLLWAVSEKEASRGDTTVTGGLYSVLLIDPSSGAIEDFDSYFAGRAPFGAEEITGFNNLEEGGAVYIGTRAGDAYCYKGGRFERLLKGKKGVAIQYAIPAAGQSFWVLAPGALLRVDTAFQVLERDSLPDSGAGLSYLSDGRLLVKRYGGWEKGLDNPKYAIKEACLPLQYRLCFEGGAEAGLQGVYFMLEDQKGRLWIKKKDNLLVFDPRGRKIFDFCARYPEDCLPEYNFSGFSGYVDRNGLGWFRFADKIILLQVFRSPFQPWMDKGDFSIRSILPLADSFLLVNSYNGAQVLNRFTGSHHPLPVNEAFLGTGGTRAQDGSLWIAVHGEEAIRLDGKSQRATRVPLSSPYPFKVETIQPEVDKHGVVWLGTEKGLARLDSANHVFRLCEEANAQGRLKDYQVNYLRDEDDGLWLATSGGLFVLDNSRKKVRHLFDGRTGLLHFFRQGPDTFWLATAGKGLARWDRRRGEARYFTTEEGLSSNTVYAVYPDSLGRLWLPTKNRLNCFDPSTGTVRHFGKAFGLPSEEFNFTAHFQAGDGTIYFGGLNGLIAFRPSEAPSFHEVDIPLQLVGLQQLDNKSGLLKECLGEYHKMGKIILAPNSNVVNLEFALLEYLTPDQHQFAYRVGGLEEKWQYTSSNKLRLGQLPYGKYTLQVKAQSWQDTWSNAELHIPVVVTKPYYLQPWFLLLALAGLVVLLRVVIRLRLRQLRQSQQRLEEAVRVRTARIVSDRKLILRKKEELATLNHTKDKLFSLLGHELRSSAFYLSNISERLNYWLEKGDMEQARQLGQHIDELAWHTDRMLDNIINWGRIQAKQMPIEKKEIDIKTITGELIASNQKVAALKQLSFQQEIPAGQAVYADRSGLAIVLQNLISNAIKFSHPGGVISLGADKRTDGSLALYVADKGIGIADCPPGGSEPGWPLQQRQGTEGEAGMGLGLGIVRDIVDLHNGALELYSQDGKGTTFTVVLPPAIERE